MFLGIIHGLHPHSGWLSVSATMRLKLTKGSNINKKLRRAAYFAYFLGAFKVVINIRLCRFILAKLDAVFFAVFPSP